MPVITTGHHADAARTAAAELQFECILCEARKFPDGETYVKLPKHSFDLIRKEPTIVVSNTYPDSGIIRSLFMLQMVREVQSGDVASLNNPLDKRQEASPQKLILCAPYYGYSRQDKRFLRGESISARSLANTFAHIIDGLVVIDIHAKEPFQGLSVDVIFESISPEISKFLNTKVKPDFILAPDQGALDRVANIASKANIPHSYLVKKRIDAHTITHEPKNLDVRGSVVAIIDDMISTGGTIIRASEALKGQGAQSVHAICAHGLYSQDALTTLRKSLDTVTSSNTLSNPASKIDAGFAIARGASSLISP